MGARIKLLVVRFKNPLRSQAADADIFRAAEHYFEIQRVECQPHAEHHHTKQIVDGTGIYPVERSRAEHRYHANQQHQYGHIFDNERVNLSEHNKRFLCEVRRFTK